MTDESRKIAAKVIDFAEARRRLHQDLSCMAAANERSGAPQQVCAPPRREMLGKMLAESFEEKRHRHMLRRLADALMAQAQIPEGNFLGAFLGVGIEFDNRHAVLEWVRQHEHLIAESVELGVSPLEHLYDALSRHFEDRAGEGPR